MQIAARLQKILVPAVGRVVGSSTNYWIAMFSDLAAAAAFLALGVYRFAGSWPMAGALVIVGFIAGGLLEYVFHRWVLHGPPSVARSGHLQHHADPRALVSAPLFVITATALAIWGVLALILPSGVAAFVVFGLYSRYNYFAIVHHFQHRRAPARMIYFRRLEQLHHLHHHRQVVNFGISTTIWDRLFGTYLPASKLPRTSSNRRSVAPPERRNA